MILSTSEQEKLNKDLQKFRKQYPNLTSGDIQSFIMGWVFSRGKNKRKYLKKT
jgi:hypothetical protein